MMALSSCSCHKTGRLDASTVHFCSPSSFSTGRLCPASRLSSRHQCESLQVNGSLFTTPSRAQSPQRTAKQIPATTRRMTLSSLASVAFTNIYSFVTPLPAESELVGVSCPGAFALEPLASAGRWLLRATTASALHSAAQDLAVHSPLIHLFPPEGLNGYALQLCLRKVRKAREAAQVVEEGAGGDGEAPGGSSADAVREERLRKRQYEQPGTLVTLPSGTREESTLRPLGPDGVYRRAVCERMSASLL